MKVVPPIPLFRAPTHSSLFESWGHDYRPGSTRDPFVPRLAPMLKPGNPNYGEENSNANPNSSEQDGKLHSRQRLVFAMMLKAGDVGSQAVDFRLQIHDLQVLGEILWKETPKNYVTRAERSKRTMYCRYSAQTYIGGRTGSRFEMKE